MLRAGAPLPWMSGTSAKGSGMVGTMPDHSMALVLQGDPPLTVPLLQPVDVAAARDPVGLVAVAADKEIIGLGVGDIAVDLAAVVQQIVMRRHLPLRRACPWPSRTEAPAHRRNRPQR